jgi:hypothetical protein
MLKSLLRTVCRAARPPGTPRWCRTQGLFAVLPRARGGRPCLRARFYRLTLPRCGSGLQLHGAVHLHRPERISIGSACCSTRAGTSPATRTSSSATTS